jgi:type VI secretion system Hcp family effector
MAVDMFINFKSAIYGGALDKSRPKDIQIWSFSFGAKRPTDIATHVATGRTMMSDFTFTKSADISSPMLLTACVNNQAFTEVNVFMRKSGQTPPLDYVKITMNNVGIRVFDFDAGQAVADAGVAKMDELEKIILVYEKISFSFTEQTSSGQAGASSNMSWSLG